MAVKSLAELCVQICQKHINQLTSFGDGDVFVPPGYVREILLRVTDPTQLRQIEINSPYIDTADIWKRLISREFPVESRDKDYIPPKPAQWYEVYEKYSSERQISQMEAEEQLRRQFQGLQEQKDSRVSKLVDQRFLPRPPKTGRSIGGQNRSSKVFSRASSFGGGGRSKLNSGASVLRRARREAAEHALMRGVLATPSNTPPTGAVKMMPAYIVEGRRMLSQPFFRPYISQDRPSTRTAFRAGRNDLKKPRSTGPTYTSSATVPGLRHTHADTPCNDGRQLSGQSVQQRNQVSTEKSTGKPPLKPVRRPGLLSNAPKNKVPIVANNSDQQLARTSNFTSVSTLTLAVHSENSAPGARPRKTTSGSSLQSPEQSPGFGPPSVPSNSPASAKYSPVVLARKRKQVDIFMPAKKRRPS